MIEYLYDAVVGDNPVVIAAKVYEDAAKTIEITTGVYLSLLDNDGFEVEQVQGEYQLGEWRFQIVKGYKGRYFYQLRNQYLSYQKPQPIYFTGGLQHD